MDLNLGWKEYDPLLSHRSVPNQKYHNFFFFFSNFFIYEQLFNWLWVLVIRGSTGCHLVRKIINTGTHKGEVKLRHDRYTQINLLSPVVVIVTRSRSGFGILPDRQRGRLETLRDLLVRYLDRSDDLSGVSFPYTSLSFGLWCPFFLSPSR